MKTRKPLGELFSGEKFDVNAELNQPAGKETLNVNELRQNIAAQEANLRHLHKVLRDYEESLPDVKTLMKKEEWELMASSFRQDQERFNEILEMRSRLEKLDKDEIPQKMKELMEKINEEEVELKKLKDLLLDENWDTAGIGDA